MVAFLDEFIEKFLEDLLEIILKDILEQLPMADVLNNLSKGIVKILSDRILFHDFLKESMEQLWKESKEGL